MSLSEPPKGESSGEQPKALSDGSEVGTAVTMPDRRQDVARRFMEALRPKRGLAEAHYKEGVTCLERGDPSGAIGHLSKALQLRPAYAEAWFDRGAAHAGDGGPPPAARPAPDRETQSTKIMRIGIGFMGLSI